MKKSFKNIGTRMTTVLSKNLYNVCKNGDIDAVNTAIIRGNTNWNRGLHGACYSGNVELVELL